MAVFNKYQVFVEDLAEKKHNLGSDVLKVLLSNAAPNQATNAVLADAGEISAGSGYTAGGNAAAVSTSAQTAGTYKLVLSDPAAWLAAGGSIGPFRYAILYNSTASGGPLIGFWDYASSITLADGESFTVDLDQVNGVLTLA